MCLLSEYLQVWAAAAKIEISCHGAVVILIVEAVVVAAVLFALTEIHPEEYFTADMKLSLNGVSALWGYSSKGWISYF